MTSASGPQRKRKRAEVERRPPPPAGPVRRGLGGLGFWATLLAGAWLGRVSVALPDALGEAFDLLLPLAAAVFVFLSYRRWIRARVAASAAARARAARQRNGRQE